VLWSELPHPRQLSFLQLPPLMFQGLPRSLLRLAPQLRPLRPQQARRPPQMLVHPPPELHQELPGLAPIV